MRHWILIVFLAGIFRRKWAIERCYNFPPHLINVSARPCKNWKHGYYTFSLKCCVLLCWQTHRTYQNYHLVVVKLSFIHKTINCMNQTWPTQGTKHPAIWYAHSRHSPCLPWYRAPGCRVSYGSLYRLTLKVIGHYQWDFLLHCLNKF